MARKFYTEDEVLQSLRKKNDVRISDNLVQVLKSQIYNEKTDSVGPNPSARQDLGNKSWGKIDFLVNHLGYHKIFVGKFS